MTGTGVDSTAGLLEELRRVPVLSGTQRDEAARLSARFADGLSLARELVRRRWLSSFQANLLLAGRAASLRFGPYLLLDRLGEGATGQVFKARHTAMQRLVALKVLRPELLADAEVVQRFHREAQLISQLSHPHIVHAFDAGLCDGAHFLVMEFIEGADLERIVRQQGPLSPALACRYMHQAALGLQHAHEKGLVHRDIKPSNLLLSGGRSNNSDRSAGISSVTPMPTQVSGAPHIKILDLGLARVPRQRADDGAALTLAGKGMMGTPDYLAPEQALDFHAADIRSDLYSLGCTFYFLLTGQPPFANGTLAQKLMKHQQAEPPPFEQFRQDVPADIQAVVRRLLAKRPVDRYPTPSALAEALRPMVQKATALTGIAPRQRDSTLILSASPDVPHSRPRRRQLAIGAIGLLAAGLLFGLVALLDGSPSPTSGTVARARPTSSIRATEPGPRIIAGNVALATEGATVTGPGPSAALIDGVTTGYTGYLGFAQGAWPCAWTVQLAYVCQLQEIRLLLWDGNRRNYRYLLEVSADGQTFSTLADRRLGDWRSWQTITFPARPVKAIRLQGLYNSDNKWFHIVELEAYCLPPPRPAIPRFPSVPPATSPAAR
ncbi:MAG: protein kinase [Planctomycetia bacterium]|nr:protein kinase [Planctomycetia bacterium]